MKRIKQSIRAIKKYFEEVAEEIKKVSWPSKKQTTQLSLIVIGVSIVLGVIIALLDSFFSKIIIKI